MIFSDKHELPRDSIAWMILKFSYIKKEGEKRQGEQKARINKLVTISKMSEMEQLESSEKYGAEEVSFGGELSCLKSSMHMKRCPSTTNSDRGSHDISAQFNREN